MDNPLDPRIIAIFPRHTTAVVVIGEMLSRESGRAVALAIASNMDEVASYHASWRHFSESLDLIIMACFESKKMPRVLDAFEILFDKFQGHPIGVLIGDGADLPGFARYREGAWNEELAQQLTTRLRSVQVFEYRQEWMRRPPRIR